MLLLIGEKMKNVIFILLIIILQGCKYPLLYKSIIYSPIKEVEVKFSYPMKINYLPYYSTFEGYYPKYGAKTTFSDKQFLKEFKSNILRKKEKPLSHDFNTWIKLEIKYYNGKKDIIYTAYKLQGYYFNNKRIGHSGQFNKFLYEKLVEKFDNNEIICVGDSCSLNRVKSCLNMLYATQYNRKELFELMNKNRNSD